MRAVTGLMALCLVASMLSIVLYMENDQFREWVDSKRFPASTSTVGPEGGTLSFDDGVTISVPKGAVTKETTLRYGKVVALDKGDSGPFDGIRSSATQFDVALLQDDRSVQPATPLLMQLPLKGQFAGKGTPLAYTVLTGGRHALLPSKQQKPGVLTIQLPHLSPKVLTYLSDAALVDLFKETAAIQDRGTCKQEVTVGGTKVRMGDRKRGWSLKDDSAIFACLVAGDGTANVGIVNRIDYMLSVAATSNVRIATSGGDVETELIKLINNRIFPNHKVKALLSSGEKLVGKTKLDNLPATVELQASPSTFFSEVAYNTVGLVVGLLTGEGNGPKLAQKIDRVFNDVDVLKCMQTSAQHMGDSPGMGDVAKTLYDCFLPIAGAMAKQLDIQWWRVGWVIGALQTGVETVTRSVNGIKLTLNNTMRVSVEADLQLDGFTGKWWVHGSNLTINADGTGTQTWNAGPCESDVDAGMCTGYSPLSVSKVEGGIRVTRTADAWYESSQGGRHVPWHVRENGEDMRSGDSSVLLRISDTALKSTSREGFGNPYLCRPGGPEELEGKCGA